MPALASAPGPSGGVSVTFLPSDVVGKLPSLPQAGGAKIRSLESGSTADAADPSAAPPSGSASPKKTVWKCKRCNFRYFLLALHLILFTKLGNYCSLIIPPTLVSAILTRKP
jgi:hypothetical protein